MTSPSQLSPRAAASQPDFGILNELSRSVALQGRQIENLTNQLELSNREREAAQRTTTDALNDALRREVRATAISFVWTSFLTCLKYAPSFVIPLTPAFIQLGLEYYRVNAPQGPTEAEIYQYRQAHPGLSREQALEEIREEQNEQQRFLEELNNETSQDSIYGQ